MKFAIISDVHGNLPALNTVIEDAEKRNIDGLIFVGDYCLNSPWPDECITRIRQLDNAYVIRGNEERYLENLVGKDPNTWLDGQMQISYWVYQKLSSENLNYLLSLPTNMSFSCHDVSVNMAHSSADFIGACELKEWRTSKVAERYKDGFVSPETFKQDIHNYLENDQEFGEVLDDLSDGIYIFGHSHIQWSYQSADGRKLLINPGSCGLPLDCIEHGVPYTILEIQDKENIFVEERRVAFDKGKYIELLLESEQFEKAYVWTRIIAKEIKTNREHITFFFKHVEEYAAKIGDKERPYSVSTWEKAFELCAERYEL